MPRGRITRSSGWHSSRARSCSQGCDGSSGQTCGRACRHASGAQRVDHSLDEISIPLSETIPEAQTNFIAGIDNYPDIQPHPSEASVVEPVIPTTSSIMDKTCIPLLASLVKDRFTLFHGGTDPWEAHTWLQDIECTFEYMSCSDTEKVELAVYHFRGQATIWWKMQKTIFEDQVISWQLFREAFERQYFPTFCIARRLEFIRLKQGDRSVMEYNAEFSRLAEFCPHLVARDYDRMLQFTQGLASYIWIKMSEFPITTYRDALDRAIFIEMTQQQVSQEREISCSTSHSKQQSRDRRPNSQSTIKDPLRPQKVARISQGSTHPPSPQQRQISDTVASTSILRCFKCGARNHRATECSLDQSICFYCKLPGHMSRNCTLRAQDQVAGSQTQHGRRIPRPPQSQHQRSPQKSQSFPQWNPTSIQSIQKPQLYHLQSQSTPQYLSTPLQQYLLPLPQQYLSSLSQQYLLLPPQQYLLSTPQQYLLPPTYQSSAQSHQLQGQSHLSSTQRVQHSGLETRHVYALTHEEAQRAGGLVIRDTSSSGSR